MLTDAAYGFRIAGGPHGSWLSARGAEHWPLLTLERDAGIPAEDIARVDITALRAQYLDRATRGRAHSSAAWPYARAPGGAPWGGRNARRSPPGGRWAWAVIGPKEAGKSTLLACCAREGSSVLSDDVIVLDGGRVLTGPRCIDLREASAARLGPGVPVRRMTRRRLTLPPAPAEAKLRGFVHLAWGAETALVPLRPSERLARLAERRAQEGWPAILLLLELAARPAFELRRPRDLQSLDESAALLIERLELTPGQAVVEAEGR